MEVCTKVNKRYEDEILVLSDVKAEQGTGREEKRENKWEEVVKPELLAKHVEKFQLTGAAHTPHLWVIFVY